MIKSHASWLKIEGKEVNISYKTDACFIVSRISNMSRLNMLFCCSIVGISEWNSYQSWSNSLFLFRKDNFGNSDFSAMKNSPSINTFLICSYSKPKSAFSWLESMTSPHFLLLPASQYRYSKWAFIRTPVIYQKYTLYDMREILIEDGISLVKWFVVLQMTWLMFHKSYLLRWALLLKHESSYLHWL